VQHLSPLQTIADDAITAMGDDLLALSHAISDDPELGFDEHRAAARVAGMLNAEGFAVEVGAYGLPTAIEALYGVGETTIIVVGEYDALPGIGHACGHNVIAAAGVGTALGLRTVADQLGVRIKFLGTPAEETGGGKVFMLERGAWDDGTFSMMVHGGPSEQIHTVGGRSQALEYIEVRFFGRSAHAAIAPHEGINAANAVTMAQVGFGLLRQQLPPGVIISSLFKAGTAVNIIPEIATMSVEIRSDNSDSWELACARVREVIAGAALATGCTWEIETPAPSYAPLDQDVELATLFDEALADLRGDRVSNWGAAMIAGSTDMGDVSQYLPSIHPMVALTGTEGMPHHVSFTRAARSAVGDLAVLNGARALSRTAIAAVENEAIHTRLRTAQRDRPPHPRGMWADATIPALNA
jgi:amidohydrolase